MLKTVHGLLIAIILTVLCSGICGVRINQEAAVAVTDKFLYNNLDLESLQLVEPLKTNENDVEVIPEDDVSTILKAIKEQQNENEDSQRDTKFGEAGDVVKQRMTRQAAHQYSPLYPQLPSGPPYNPYQPQPNSNPPGQNPYQNQPGYNPYTQNPNQQQPGYNPYTLNPNQQQPGYNPYTHNPNQQQSGYNSSGQNTNQKPPSFNPYGQNPYQPQPNYNPYSQNPNQQQPAVRPAGQNPFSQPPPQWNSNSYNSSLPGNHNYNPNAGIPNSNQGPYNSSSGQNSYNYRPNYPSYNSSSPGNPYRPPYGQNSPHNQTFNLPPNPASFRPPNASGSGYTNPYAPYQPGRSTYNNYPPSSGNIHPVVTLNSTTQRPPYFNPSQYPSYNNSRPTSAQWQSSANSQYPNFPGAQPAQGTYNAALPRSSQSSPYYPGPNGQFPSSSYNPSVPNYPPQGTNQGQNNFFYPQKNNSVSYDPRTVPSYNFSYH